MVMSAVTTEPGRGLPLLFSRMLIKKSARN